MQQIIAAVVISRLQKILPPKMAFSFIKKSKFRQKFCHKTPNFAIFRHLKVRLFNCC